MTRPLYLFINILIYWVIVTWVVGLETGSFGRVFALILGGLIFALVSMAVEPILVFLKFPGNFWGFLIIGFLLNFALFVFYDIGLFPSVLVVKNGSIGDGFSPLPVPTIQLTSSILVVIVSAVFATLMQILVRRISTK